MTDGWPAGPVTVRVPATSANLGPGFDSLGLALTLHDTVTARVVPAGVTVEVAGEGAATAAHGEQHLVVRAMRAAFAHLRCQPPGLALSCRNEIPQGFGLGSSAAAIAAGLLAARALAGPPALAAFPDPEVLALATRLEGHPDNVAACLSGALTIAWTPTVAPGVAVAPAPARVADPAETPSPRVARLVPLPGITPVLCVPATPLPTVTARQALPAQVPHADAAANSARAALLVAALTSQPDLLLAATEDFLHQRYRSAAMPGTARLIAALRAAGLPAVISGAGPSVLALTVTPAGPAAPAATPPGSLPAADPAPELVAAIAAADPDDWRVLPLHVDTAGAQLL